MKPFNEEDIISIVKQYGHTKVLEWSLENYANGFIGELGEHLRLGVKVHSESDMELHLTFFVKCIPRFDKWKADYLKELRFFKKEYVALTQIFKNFHDDGSGKWRPKLLFGKEDVFVFEDLGQLGYKMQNNRDTLSCEATMAAVESLAKFHAQSYIYEEKRSKELQRTYRIWEDYSDFLKETPQAWRTVGRNAVIDFLKVYSKHKNMPNFAQIIEREIPKLFDRALELMKPSSQYRNVVVHRDLWMNNILFRKDNNEKIHAVFVDYQTVLYTCPMLDLAALLFFNTSKDFRSDYSYNVLFRYYKTLSQELEAENIDIDRIIDENTLVKAYQDNIMFGLIQASLVIPITVMDTKRRQEIFCNPDTLEKVNNISRSQEFIQVAKEDKKYRDRILELFDDIVDRYIIL